MVSLVIPLGESKHGKCSGSQPTAAEPPDSTFMLPPTTSVPAPNNASSTPPPTTVTSCFTVTGPTTRQKPLTSIES
ncbi:MAG: hypothetical protein E6I88_03335 [Chloroflexi bacterium]|nr:MAG: hypothetical protein E6I88_03335 [Chloroflexota bacterium]